MTLVAGLLVLALLGQPQPRTYYWRDAAGQTHITNEPPPSDAELLDRPPPAAVEPARPSPPEIVRHSASQGGHQAVTLSAGQQLAWENLNQHIAKARAAGDRRTLEAISDSLISDCLWGNGLWAMPAAPVLSLALMGLLGWWLALGFRSSPRLPTVTGFLVLGLALGQLLLNVFLYQPQAVRLKQNLELLEQHMGTGKALRPEYRELLQQRYQALEQAAEPLQLPWHFPAEVRSLRAVMRRVMVEP